MPDPPHPGGLFINGSFEVEDDGPDEESLFTEGDALLSATVPNGEGSFFRRTGSAHNMASRRMSLLSEHSPPPEDDDDTMICWHGEDEEEDDIVNELRNLQDELHETGLTEGQAAVWMRFEEEAANHNMRLPVEQAALYLRDCLIGDHFEFDNDSIYWYKWFRSRRMRLLLKTACIFNILMAVAQIRTEDDSQKVLNWIIVPVELGCLIVFTFQSFLQYKFLKRKAFFQSTGCITLAVCTLVYFVDLFILPPFFGEKPLLTTVQDTDRTFLLRFYIRPIYAFFYFTLLRETLPNIVKSAKALIPVVLFVFIFLCVFAIYGFMLFFKRNKYFANAPQALYQLLISLTTANFPDVMVPSYAHPYLVNKTYEKPYWNETGETWVSITRVEVSNATAETTQFAYNWNALSYYLSPFFFILFYLVGMYFLLSIAFAVVYNVYKDNLRRQVLNKYSFRLKMLGRAYRCLMNYIDEGYDDVNRTRTEVQRKLGDRRHSVRETRRQSVLGRTASPNVRPAVTPMSAEATPGGADFYTFGEAPAEHRSRAERLMSVSGMDDGMLPAGMVNLARKETKQKSKGVDLYLFELLYYELMGRKDEHYPDEIVTGSVVALLKDSEVNHNTLLPMGSTGIVRHPQRRSQGLIEIDFQGITYQAKPADVILVEPAGHDKKMIKVFFSALDMNESNLLDIKQFRNLYQLLQLKVSIVRDTRLFVEKALPHGVFHSACFQAVLRFGKGKWLERIIAAHILASVVLMVVHFSYIAEEASHGDNYLSTTWYNFMYAEIAVGVVFDMETGLKVLCWGWSDYWTKKWNKYDFFMSVLNIGIYISLGVISWYYSWEKAMAMVMELQMDTAVKSNSTPDLIMVVLLARLVRVVRIVSENRDFRYILKTFANILPIFASYICVVFVVYFYFASIGMLFLKDANIPLTTEYSRSDYYALNFDSFYNSCITLWCIMIVNNWYIIVDGYRAALGDWVIIYFVSFWMICVLLLMNVVTALVVEVWGSQWELNKEKAVNIDKNPLAKRIHALNYLTPEDGIDYYKLGLPPDPDGSRPRYKVSYKNYSHKVTLALERIFLQQKGFEHIIA